MSRFPDTDTVLSRRAVPKKLHIDDTKTGTNESNRGPEAERARATGNAT